MNTQATPEKLKTNYSLQTSSRFCVYNVLKRIMSLRGHQFSYTF